MTIQALAPTLTTATAPRSITRYAATAARVLLGLVFFVCGLDGFLHFLPQPTEPPSEGAMALAIALMKSGYMFPLIKGTEVAAGALLLANRFVPLALVVIASVLVALELALAWIHRSAYRPLLAARTPARGICHAPVTPT